MMQSSHRYSSHLSKFKRLVQGDDCLLLCFHGLILRSDVALDASAFLIKNSIDSLRQSSLIFVIVQGEGGGNVCLYLCPENSCRTVFTGLCLRLLSNC